MPAVYLLCDPWCLPGLRLAGVWLLAQLHKDLFRLLCWLCACGLLHVRWYSPSQVLDGVHLGPQLGVQLLGLLHRGKCRLLWRLHHLPSCRLVGLQLLLWLHAGMYRLLCCQLCSCSLL